MCPAPVDESLQTPLAPAKKKPRVLKVVVYVVSGLALAYAATCGGLLAYFNWGYDLPIFINGVSMYPYLNADAERLENGSYRPMNYLDGNSINGDKLDYGYAKSRDRISIAKEVKRYDIVTTYYPTDYQTYSDGSYKRDSAGKLMLFSGAAPKIKRVIALPSETVRYDIVKAGEDENSNPIWGKTTITSSAYPNGEVLKPLYTTKDYKIGSAGYSYPHLSYSWAQDASSFTLELKNNEYLVAGDNRGYSSDGLSKKFAVTEEMIQAKVYIIVGKAKMTVTASGNEIAADYSFIFTPWNYRRLD